MSTNAAARSRPRPAPVARLVSAIILAAACGCASVYPPASSRRVEWAAGAAPQGRARVGPFLVHADGPSRADDPALLALAGLQPRLERTLGLSIPEDAATIDVFILEDEPALMRFLRQRHPDLPDRRAFFLASPSGSVIYACRGPHLAEDLRHEATHALLREGAGPVPLWLDEGLAEYFEVEPALAAEETDRRFARLAGEYHLGWRPDLRRLEGLEDAMAMSPTDYREAFAWVAAMLHGPERRLLVSYLDGLRGVAPGPFTDRLDRDAEPLEARVVALVRRVEDPDDVRVTRLQSPSARVVVPASRADRPPALGAPIGPVGRAFDALRRGFDRLAEGLSPGPPPGADRSWPPG